MIKKAVKIQLELILPFGFDEYEFLEDLERSFDDLDYVGACQVEILEVHEQVFLDEEALASQN